MSEQRFEFKLKVNFIDEETGEEIYHKVLIDNSNGNEIGFDDMVGLLNEQQDTISQLQDLCGKSDGENAKLRIENEKLRKELNELLTVHTKIMQTLDDEFVSKALLDGGDGV